MNASSAASKPRAVVDTNVFISAILVRNGAPDQLLTAWMSGRFTLVLTALLEMEIAGVLARPRIRRRNGFDESRERELVERLANSAEFVTPLDVLSVAVRDPKDAKVLSCALGGRADYLVTGDQDLLVLQGHPAIEPLRIVTAARFLEELDARESGSQHD